MALKYTSEVLFNRFLQADEDVPSFVSGSAPSLENVGTGDSSETHFYFDQKNIIKDSETIYTGSTVEAGATTTLTRTTHYSIDFDKAKLTLTTSGVASVASTSIFTTYSYNRFGTRNELITEALERAEKEVDNSLHLVLYDGTAATPDFGIVTDEVHEGQGGNNRVYNTWYYPINPMITTASGAISSGATTVTVVSTNGFPSSGYFGVENDKVTYTSKSSTVFSGCSGLDSDHVTSSPVTSFVVERALDDEGNSPNYTVMDYLSQYEIDFDSGEIKIANSSIAGTVLLDNFQPPIGVWDRVRFSYQYGYDEIYGDVIRLVHLIAAKELYSGQVLNVLGRGKDGFSSEGIISVSEEIDKLKKRYKAWKCIGVRPQTIF